MNVGAAMAMTHKMAPAHKELRVMARRCRAPNALPGSLDKTLRPPAFAFTDSPHRRCDVLTLGGGYDLRLLLVPVVGAPDGHWWV